MSPLADRARALLAQPVPEGPTVMEIIELHSWLEDEWRANNDGEDLPTLDFARAVLARWGRPTPQPVAEGPTDEEIADWHDQCADLTRLGEADHYWAFDLRSDEVAGVVCAALARWGRPTPQPEGTDIHYAWELHDAEGEWQAGGSANSLEDVQREGNRYLQTYSQDGPHKLIIQRHCVSTIEEAQQ